jgi:hypothetical protein
MIYPSLQRQAFYRSGPTFWQRYTSFWLSSLLSRITFFIIPIIVTLIPLIGFAPRIYRWLYVRRIDQLHRALRNLERELAQSADTPRLVEYQKRIAEIESDVRLLRVARAFEVDLQRLRPEAKRGSAGSQSRAIATCAGCSSPARWPSSDMRANTARGGPGSLA